MTVKRAGRIQRIGQGSFILVAVVSLLSGCIRPDMVTPTPDPNATPETAPVSFNNPTSPVPTSPSVGFQPTPTTNLPQVAVNAALVEQQLPNFDKTAQAGSLTIWYQLPVENSILLGYSFRNPSGLNCVGTGFFENNNIQLAATCATELSAPMVSVQGLFLLSSGRVAILAAGEVVNGGDGTAIILYDNGAQQAVTMSGGRFFAAVYDEINFAQQVQIVNAQGQVVTIQAIPR